MSIPCIGLFGTCGNSTWRERFIAHYREHGIRYFNPQVSDWKPEYADIEAEHLKRDEIILFPVTGETYGTGSLSEVGFSIMQAIQNTGRYIIVMIEDEMDEALGADAVAFKESTRARALVKAHLAANPHPNVFVVDDFNDMLALSTDLYGVSRKFAEITELYRIA